jgi:uncharacterized SAM-binding protein YcdF (DUF218 family)
LALSFTCRLVGLVTIVVYGLLAFTPICDELAGHPAATSEARALEPASAIVTLGAGLSFNRMLSARSLRRTVHAVALYRRGLAPLLVLLGPSQGKGPDEAGLRAELARELGVPHEAILADGKGRTTGEEALRVKALLAPRGVKKILLVTGLEHMPRARQFFASAGFEVVPAPLEEMAGRPDRPGERIVLFQMVLREFLARQYYRFIGRL